MMPKEQKTRWFARKRAKVAPVQPKLEQQASSFSDFALRSLRSDKLTLAAMGMLLVLGLLCFPLAGPITKVLKIDPNDTDLMATFERPSKQHPLGADQVGRDQLARLLYGGRVSLGVAFFAALIIVTLGVTVGTVAGYYGGYVDDFIIWFISTMNSIPLILLLLIVSVLFKPTVTMLTTFIALVSWTGVSRIVRGQVLQVKEMDYVLAARTLGASSLRIAGRHILPNVIPIVIIFGVQVIGGVILLESALSFLGLGIQPPTATWGNMLTKAQSYFFLGPHLVIWPGLFISITVLCLYIIGDGLRDALDPMMRGKR